MHLLFLVLIVFLSFCIENSFAWSGNVMGSNANAPGQFLQNQNQNQNNNNNYMKPPGSSGFNNGHAYANGYNICPNGQVVCSCINSLSCLPEGSTCDLPVEAYCCPGTYCKHFQGKATCIRTNS